MSLQSEAKPAQVPTNARASLDADFHIGQRVRRARKALDMSQTELGNELGISFQQVQKYEKGTNRIGSGRLWEVSKVLGVPIDYFFDGISDDEPSDSTVPWWIVDLAKQIGDIEDTNVQKHIISLIEACSSKS